MHGQRDDDPRPYLLSRIPDRPSPTDLATIMVSESGVRGKNCASYHRAQYGLSSQTGSGVISSCGFAPGSLALVPLTVMSGRTAMSSSQ